MDIIVLASRKGGAGKTTLAAHIAVEAYHKQVGPVAIMDFDPMGNLASWFNERKLDGPIYAAPDARTGGLQAELARLQKAGVALVVIDTPPAATAGVADILAQATLVVIPVIPSANDLRTIGSTLDIVEGAGRPLIFVVNNASTSGKHLTQGAAVTLSQFGTVCPSIIRTREDFRNVMTDGRVVSELKPGDKSAEEIAGLWAYLATRLEKLHGNRPGQTT
jgi:chromosome partitioning protein